jgi:hypothetical protein
MVPLILLPSSIYGIEIDRIRCEFAHIKETSHSYALWAHFFAQYQEAMDLRAV